MTAIRVMLGIPKKAQLILTSTEFEDLRETDGGDDDYIWNGESLVKRAKFKFYTFTAHVVMKEQLLKRLKQAYPRFVYVQITE